MNVTFAPHATTVIELKLVSKGVPYWSRPDLGIERDDVKVEGTHEGDGAQPGRGGCAGVEGGAAR